MEVMNKIVSKLYIALLATLVTLLSACTPETYELGSQDIVSDDLAEGIAFSITHDAVNPNIVYLKSLMPSNYQVCWEHPQGRSQNAEVKLQMPFEGE